MNFVVKYAMKIGVQHICTLLLENMALICFWI